MWLQRITCSTCLLGAFLSIAAAESPLHERVDALIENHPGFDASSVTDASDAEFLRRVSLDLTGVIPSATAVREFTADTSSDKRTRVVDELLASPEYARRMQYVFDVMLMERGPDTHVRAAKWQGYLRRSFAENRPWDELVAEMLSADGTDEATRPAAKFLLDRKLDPNLVTRDLGRVFLGRDLQCAQCHDHPNVDDYLQRHYYGLTAFLKRSYLFKDRKSGVTTIGEKAEGDVEFTSVFTNESGGTAPRMLDLPPLDDPMIEGEPYEVKPVKNVRAVPVYSRRLQLAKAMTDDANTAFRLNIANRIWKLTMGRGLVEPVDMWHADNPPSHPELLELLAADLRAHDYDLRYLLRELALTRAYQRGGRASGDVEPTEVDYSVALMKPLTPEQLAWSMMQATGVVDRAREKVTEKKPLEEILRTEVAKFVTVFGVKGARTTDFDAAAGQALFLRNGPLVRGWIDQPDGPGARLAKLDDTAAAEELYLAVYSRRPTADETAFVTEYLDAAESREAAIRQLVWATLASAEFRFNH